MERKQNRRISSREVLVRYLRRRWLQSRWTVQTCCGITFFVVSVGAGLPFIFQPKHARSEMAAARQPVAATGLVQGTRAKGVGSPFNGKVKRVAVKLGQEVKKGDVLFVMEDGPLRRDLQLAKLKLKAAREEVRQLEAERRTELAAYDQQLNELNETMRTLRLTSSREVAPTVLLAGDGYYTIPAGGYETDPYLLAYEMQAVAAEREALWAERRDRDEVWRSALQSAREQLREVEGQVWRLQSQINARVRRSPLNGVVTQLRAEPGRYVRAKTTLVRVDDPRGYRIVAKLDNQARERLDRGDRVVVRYQDETQSGGLTKIVNGWDKDLFYYWVWVKPERPKTLWPGQRVEVALPSSQMQLAAH